MSQTLPFTRGPRVPAVSLLLLMLILGTLLYLYRGLALESPPAPVFATATGPGGLEIPFEITTSDLDVEWTGGDFDPRDKCPPDFFTGGFVLLCKRLADGRYFKFLYHKGKKLLYRIDKDLIDGQTRIGLHWVEGTRYSARYRIADKAFKGGKTVQVPQAGGISQPRNFQYGEAVSRKRVQPGRELFRETHIIPDQCPEWLDILDFTP